MIAYIMKRLGSPVIQINVAPDQVEVAIDEAIQLFVSHHRDGNEETFYAYEVKAEDVANGYIPVPDHIYDIIEVVPKGYGLSNMDFATVEWQMVNSLMSQGRSFVPIGLADWNATRMALTNVNIMVGTYHQAFVFKKYKRHVVPQFQWSLGQVICFRCYEQIDPDDEGNSAAWNDPWLKAYSTAAVKEKWGSILQKADGIRLPGGVTLNGQLIYDQAVAEKADLYEQLRKKHEPPADFMIG
jgi:hypothetical protein